jgi:hypothetical protein
MSSSLFGPSVDFSGESGTELTQQAADEDRARPTHLSDNPTLAAEVGRHLYTRIAASVQSFHSSRTDKFSFGAMHRGALAHVAFAAQD